MNGIEGFVLAGGESKRMGTPKARLLLEGMSLVERAARTLEAVCDKVFIVGGGDSEKNEVLEDVRLPRVGDRRASLIGLYTALINCHTDVAAILACDLPFVNSGFLQRMKEIAAIEPGSAAVVPVQPDGRLQPLCAVYRPDLCLPMIRAAIDSGHWRLQETVSSLNIRTVEFAEIADLDGSENIFFNLNTPADFEVAAKLIVQLPGAAGRT